MNCPGFICTMENFDHWNNSLFSIIWKVCRNTLKINRYTIFFSLKRSPSCQPVSNAFEKSRKGPPYFITFIKWLIYVMGDSISWSIQVSPGLNNDWLDESQLLSSKNSYISLYINCSEIFPQITNKEIGR